MANYRIHFYRQHSKSPVEDFMLRLDARSLAKLARLIDLLKQKGPDLGMPYSRAMGQGLFELRVVAQSSIRVFYAHQAGGNIYLLHAFKKKTRQTPDKELWLALKRKRELTQI